MNGELKADGCPFCGSTEISDGEMLTEKDDGSRVTQSQCRGCGAFGPEAVTDGPDYGGVRAITAWNRRARPTPAPGALPEFPEPAAILERTWRGSWFVGADQLDASVTEQPVYTEDHLHAYARAYAEQCSAGVWLPIETAPKDGSYMLVANAHGSWIAKWHPVYQSGYRPSNPWASMMLNHDHIDKPGRFDKPTHWMPLPAPPALQSAFADDEGVKCG
jgi:Lar family restriction alleviation protein